MNKEQIVEVYVTALGSARLSEYVWKRIAEINEEILKNNMTDKTIIKNFRCSEHGSITPIPSCPKCEFDTLTHHTAELKKKILLTNADIDEELGSDIELIKKAEFGWNLYAKLLANKLSELNHQ